MSWSMPGVARSLKKKSRCPSGDSLLLVTARRPRGHPQILEAVPPGPDRREDQRPIVARQHRLRLEVGRVDRRVQVRGTRPRALCRLTCEAPDVEVAKPARSHRRKQQLVPVGTHAHFLVEAGGVAQLRHQDGGCDRLAVVRHRDAVDVDAAARRQAVEVHEGIRLSRLMHVERALFVGGRIYIGPEVHRRAPHVPVSTGAHTMRDVDVAEAETTGRRPSSDIVGAASIASPLIGAPRLTGASQSHDRHWRCDIRMSRLPRPPARVETKNSVCASDESPALASSALEWVTGPRLTGSDHSEPAKRSAWSGAVTRCGSVPHAINPKSANPGSVRCVVFMAPPCRSACEWTSRCPGCHPHRPAEESRKTGSDRHGTGLAVPRRTPYRSPNRDSPA